jgi:hypothetical protein
MFILELYVKHLKQSLGFQNLKVQKNYLQVLTCQFKSNLHDFRKPKNFLIIKFSNMELTSNFTYK